MGFFTKVSGSLNLPFKQNTKGIILTEDTSRSLGTNTYDKHIVLSGNVIDNDVIKIEGRVDVLHLAWITNNGAMRFHMLPYDKDFSSSSNLLETLNPDSATTKPGITSQDILSGRTNLFDVGVADSQSNEYLMFLRNQTHFPNGLRIGFSSYSSTEKKGGIYIVVNLYENTKVTVKG